MGVRFCSCDQTHPECGSNLEKFLLQILLLIWILPLISGEDQKKSLHRNLVLSSKFWIYWNYFLSKCPGRFRLVEGALTLEGVTRPPYNLRTGFTSTQLYILHSYSSIKLSVLQHYTSIEYALHSHIMP